jgi:hypothetical protein
VKLAPVFPISNLNKPVVLILGHALALHDGFEDGADLNLDLVHRVQVKEGFIGLGVDGLCVEDAFQVPDADPTVVTFCMRLH